MPLSEGSQFGPYRILGAAGAGGMGEVYRATDTRLDRTVALKVLPTHRSADTEARQRFEREARTISTLQHPNICTLFDVGQHEGNDYLVMEYLEGETLAERIARGTIAPAELLDIAIQVCEALGHAHRSGVVHRDLKPGNVMLTRSGVKLLDFGLARMAAAEPAPDDALTQMATRAGGAPLTQAGTILGTFQYMAPEQLEGRTADERSDIFALGAVIYEMATGRKAFEGKSQASLIASILERDPPAISAVQPMTPPALDNVVRACLAKDPDERVQTAHDVRLQLKWIKEGGSGAGIPAPVAAHRRRAGRAGWIVAGAAVLACLALGAILFLRQEEAPRVLALVADTPREVTPWIQWAGGHMAISPDGTRLAYCGNSASGSGVWLRNMETGATRLIEGTGRAMYPFWSPDSRQIAYFATGSLRVVGADGGAPVTVCEAPDGRGGAWGTDGTIVFNATNSGGLWRVPAGGGTPDSIPLPRGAGNSHRFPFMLPDGKHFLFSASHPGYAEVCVGSLDGGEPAVLMRSSSNVQYANGHLVYVRDGSLVAQPFDLSKLETTGDAVVIGGPVDYSVNFVKAAFSVSSGGAVVYGTTEGEQKVSISEVDRAGREIGTIDANAALDDITMSHDGLLLAVARSDPEQRGSDIWTWDLNRKLFTRVTFTEGADDPCFSPDARYLAFSNSDVWKVRASGIGEPEKVYASAGDDLPIDWSHDGRTLLVMSINSETGEDIRAVPVDGGEAVTLLGTTFREMHPQFSPDDRWITYTSDESGEDQVYAVDFPNLTEKVQITPDGGNMARWRADGREILFVAPDLSLHAVPVDMRGPKLAVGTPEKLFGTNMAVTRTHQFTINATADRFYLFGSASGDVRTQLRVILNWPQLVK